MAWQAWYTLAVVIAVVAVLASERVSAPIAMMTAGAALVAPRLVTTNLAILAGGLITAIGTTTNVVISGLLTASHQRPLSLLEPAPVGVAVCIAVLAVVTVMGPWLARGRAAPGEAAGDPRAFTIEMFV